MTITIKCPVCRATNTFDGTNIICRRCKNDLTLLYQFKYHSYYNRLQTVMFLLHKNTKAAEDSLKKAAELAKEK